MADKTFLWFRAEQVKVKVGKYLDIYWVFSDGIGNLSVFCEFVCHFSKVLLLFWAFSFQNLFVHVLQVANYESTKGILFHPVFRLYLYYAELWVIILCINLFQSQLGLPWTNSFFFIVISWPCDGCVVICAPSKLFRFCRLFTGRCKSTIEDNTGEDVWSIN